MAVTNHERVGKALGLMTKGPAPFVERECRAKYGDRWVQSVARMDPGIAQSGKKVWPTDAQFLLEVVWDEWQPVFPQCLGSERADLRQRAARGPQPVGTSARVLSFTGANDPYGQG